MKIPEVHKCFGILGHLLLICGITSSVLRLRMRNPLLRWTALLGCLGVMFVGIDGMSVVGYTRGLVGDLSITTQILLACTVLRHLLDRKILPDEDQKFVLVGVAVTGLFVYPMGLGLTMSDPYELGFNSLGLIIVLALVSIWTWCVRRGATVFIPASMVAFNIGILESTNIWDYLLDPLVTLYSWVWILTRVARKREKIASRTLSTWREPDHDVGFGSAGSLREASRL